MYLGCVSADQHARTHERYFVTIDTRPSSAYCGLGVVVHSIQEARLVIHQDRSSRICIGGESYPMRPSVRELSISASKCFAPAESFRARRNSSFSGQEREGTQLVMRVRAHFRHWING